MVKIAIFYHIYQYANWIEIFNEQFSLIKESGLYDEANHIHLGINGTMIPNIDDNKIVYKINKNQHMEETETIKSLKDFALKNPEYKILYIHTKGVGKRSVLMDDWRKMMNYFCIENWKRCLDLLDKNDTVGCNYMEKTWLGLYPHFSGNFWWVNSSYVDVLNHDFLETPRRWDREFWIGTGGGKMKEIYNSKKDHFKQRILRKEYCLK